MNCVFKPTLVCLLLGILTIPSLAADPISPAADTTTTTGTTTRTTKGTTTRTTKGTTTTTSTTTTKKSTSTTVRSTLTPEETCEQHNGSCSDCVDNAKCMYCYSDDSCKLYPTGKVLPPSSYCALDKARWGVCWLNFEALIISVSVIGGVIILTITSCCIYCCCCRGKNKRRYDKEDAKYEEQKMERKVKQEERRSERKGRLDEIRRKYGLVKDDAPYQRFDA